MRELEELEVVREKGLLTMIFEGGEVVTTIKSMV